MIGFEIEEGWPTADQVNAFIREIARRLPTLRPPPKSSGASFVHPFRVTAARDPRASNVEGRAWRISTALGCVNDTAAAIVYRNANDPRGWVPPVVVSGQKLDPLGLTDRTALELADPPFHLLNAPRLSGVVASDDFVAVLDTARPAFFRTSAMWLKRLFQASVTLTNEPAYAASASLPAILLSRLPRSYRLVAGRKPVSTTAYAGGSLEIATLYLLRDDNATNALADSILVRQRVFWNLFSVFAQPANPLDGAIDPDDPIGNAISDQIGADFEAAAAVSFWTV